MPFGGLKLVDYAINSALAFSNVALKKGDKIGLVNFPNKLGSFLPAQAKKTHLNLILESLYNLDTQFLDSDFGVLQALIKQKITHRSLILLYTNFEHISSLHRQLPYLQAIAKKHLLVVIFFENTELYNVIIINKSVFSSSNFKGAKLNNSYFNNSYFTSADFRSATMNNSEMRVSNFDNSSLVGVAIKFTDFSGSTFYQAIYQPSDSSNANFSGCKWVDGKICDHQSFGRCREFPN